MALLKASQGAAATYPWVGPCEGSAGLASAVVSQPTDLPHPALLALFHSLHTVSYLMGTPPCGLALWQHGGLGTVTFLTWCLPSRREECENGWASCRLPSQPAPCSFGSILLPQAATGPVQICLCGGGTKAHHSRALGWEVIHCSNLWEMCHVTSGVSGIKEAALLPAHTPGCIFKFIKPLGIAFLPCLCHHPRSLFLFDRNVLNSHKG